jgi:alpha-galactosidase
MAFWIPYFGTAVNAVEPYIFRSQMTPAVGIGLDPDRSEDGYRKLGDLLTQWRSIADYYYGDYYPLTAYSTEATAWMAWQFNRPAQGDGAVQVFRRPDSPFESARFKLRGLDPAARYKVADMDSKRVSEFTGRELLDTGLPVSIPVAPSAVILTYSRVVPAH